MMTTPKKHIAIIGGGIAGIASIVGLKEEDHEPICFEKTDKYGGTFCYREESIQGVGSVMPTTVLINTKEFGAFSNFVPPKHFSTYLHHSDHFHYITQLYNNHNCERYMKFNTEVIHVKKNYDYDETGRYLVTVQEKISGKVSTDIYDGVLVASGHFNIPKYVSFPNEEKFKGMIIHSHGLKGVAKYKDKNVLVIGSSNSALDAAVFGSSVAKKVYLSTRNGFRAMTRVGPFGYPMDHLMARRFFAKLLDILPRNVFSWIVEKCLLDTKFDQSFYPVKPKYHLLSKDPVVNDEITSKLMSGSVIVKRDVKHFTENGVVFDGEETETDIDDVILATGYTYDYSFLDKGLLEIENGNINLYKCAYPPQLPHPTLAFIGFINPFGAGIPLGEMQIRWATQLFSGNCHLPSKEVMMKEVKKRQEKNEREWAPSEYNSIHVDHFQYLENIASEIGVKPNLLKYLCTDFPLFIKLVFGPILPYQYRLEGPHKWEGARNAIMTSDERLFYALRKNKKVDKNFLQILLEIIVNFVPRNIFF